MDHDPLDDCKPCPFCGEELYLTINREGQHFAVTCDQCSATGPLAKTAEEAAENWNKAKR